MMGSQNLQAIKNWFSGSPSRGLDIFPNQIINEIQHVMSIMQVKNGWLPIISAVVISNIAGLIFSISEDYPGVRT